MRLICPNCNAQYEVSDDAIPPGGRDVQCSNCQLSWFQTEKPILPGRDMLTLSNAPEPEAATPAPEPAPESQDEPVKETAPEVPEETPSSILAEIEAEEAKAPAPAAERKPLDNVVANILREEAALGAAAAAATTEAKAPAPPVAKHPTTETARPPIPATADETRQRIAMMTAEEGGTRSGTQKQAAATADTAGSGQDAHLRTVPSINEINATLRARAQANDSSGLTEAEKVEAVERKGFRRGFFLVLFLFAILILPYVFADQITENLPQTTEFMASYVMMIDKLRFSLNEMVKGLTSG